MSAAHRHQADIWTTGGCGILAWELLKQLPGGVPALRYSGGVASHAAVMVGDRLVHRGHDDGPWFVVTLRELRAAMRWFDPERTGLCRAALHLEARRLAAEIAAGVAL